MTREQRRRNGRVVTALLVLAAIVSLSLFTFAMVTRSNAEKAIIDAELQVHRLQADLINCQRQVDAAIIQAEKAQAEAVRQLRAAHDEN